VNRLIALLALGLLAAGCGGSSQTTQPENGPIVFSSESRLEHGIVNRPPSGERTRITNGLRDYLPTWSPDGKQIAFVRPFGRRGLSHLFVIDAEGRGLHQVGSVATDSLGLSWSPDSSRIVFGDGRGISTIEPAGTGLAHVTAKGLAPAWCGQRIVFMRPPQLFVMGVDGTRVHGLVPLRNGHGHLYSLSAPSCSRDGTRILFVRTDLRRIFKPDGVKIQVVGSDGSNERTVIRVPFGQAEIMRPSWSPDGQQITFAGKRGERYGIWTVRSSGGAPRLIAEGTMYAMPNWGPRGT
jgi:Tol biopolymer transport system component